MRALGRAILGGAAFTLGALIIEALWRRGRAAEPPAEPQPPQAPMPETPTRTAVANVWCTSADRTADPRDPDGVRWTAWGTLDFIPDEGIVLYLGSEAGYRPGDSGPKPDVTVVIYPRDLRPGCYADVELQSTWRNKQVAGELVGAGTIDDPQHLP